MKGLSEKHQKIAYVITLFILSMIYINVGISLLSDDELVGLVAIFIGAILPRFAFCNKKEELKNDW